MAEAQQASDVGDVEEDLEPTNLPSTEEVEAVIRRHAGYGAVGGFVPVPVLDVAISTTIQLRMIGKLCDLYGVPFSEQAVKSTIASLVASVLPTTSAGYFTVSAVRAIPIVGPILGFGMFPALYAAVTWALGRTFAWHFSRGGTLDNVISDDVKGRFRSEFQKAEGRGNKAKPAASATA